MQFRFHLLVFMTLFVICLTYTSHVRNGTLPASSCGGNEKTLTLLDISKDCIERATLLYPNCVEDELNCRKKEKSLAYLKVATNVISEVKNSYPTCTDHKCPKCVERPKDCLDILRSGKNESGVYTIWPRTTNKSLSVYCDMDTDGGGWTVIQRRGNFSTPKDYFYKDWDSYKRGFGNITEEFWFGNDNLYAITNQAFLNKAYKIRFDLKDVQGNIGYAVYNYIRIDDEAANYTLFIHGYSGNVGDSMRALTRMKFSTKDRDNDASKYSCAKNMKGAWWYRKCASSNPNGFYQPGTDSQTGCYWYWWGNNTIGLSELEIKLRP